jgi:hypothetical protein
MIKFIDAFCLTKSGDGALTHLRERLSQTQGTCDITFTLVDLSQYASGRELYPELKFDLLERIRVGDVAIGINPSDDAKNDFSGRNILLWEDTLDLLVNHLCEVYSLQKVRLN